MSFTTKITWGADNIGLFDFSAAVAQYIASGVTDGTSTSVDNSVLRTWTTQAAAQAWIDLLNAQPTPPAEAVIIEE